VPVVLGAGLAPATAGAALLLGASMGGEQFNPGAVEIATLAGLTGQPPTEVVRRVMPANLVAGATALLVFWWRARSSRASGPAATAEELAAPRAGGPVHVHPIKAVVPVVPLVLLFLGAYSPLPAALPGHVQIGAAMLIGVLAAALASPRQTARLPAEFWSGAGYAYTHVISLIVIATLFTEAIKAHGVIELLAQGLSRRPALAIIASVVLPLGLAALTGSGIAPAVAVMKVLVPMAGALGLDPLRLGALTSVSAQLGRTMSPAAAVGMMSSAISGAPVLELVRRVAPPLLCGAAVMLAAALLGIL
jgi:DcuC family C4-dicarboxylate transporter